MLLDLILDLEDPHRVLVVYIVLLVILSRSFSQHFVHLFVTFLTSWISYLILLTSTLDRRDDIDKPFKLDGLRKFTLVVWSNPSAPPTWEFIDARENES